MITKIQSFYKYSEKLAAGGQPTADQLAMLKEAGYEFIINISPASARNALQDEHCIVEKLEMDYIHYPVDCSNLRDIHYLTIKALLSSLENKKVFIHCGGNIKTSNLIHMYHVLEKNFNELDSLKTLLQIQNPEDKWFQYFKKMGMKGINKL